MGVSVVPPGRPNYNSGNFPENSDIRKQFFSLKKKKWIFSPKTCRDWHFQNPSALWWGQFAEMAKFLVLVKMSGQVFGLGTGSATGARYPTFFSFHLISLLPFDARADCSPRWRHIIELYHVTHPAWCVNRKLPS